MPLLFAVVVAAVVVVVVVVVVLLLSLLLLLLLLCCYSAVQVLCCSCLGAHIDSRSFVFNAQSTAKVISGAHMKTLESI